MEQTTGIKLIIRHEIKEEANKKRDIGTQGETIFGEKSNSVSAAFVCLEDEIDKKIKRYLDGEDINSIVPGLEDEEEYDK